MWSAVGARRPEEAWLPAGAPLRAGSTGGPPAPQRGRPSSRSVSSPLPGNPAADSAGAAWDSRPQDRFPHEGRLPGGLGAGRPRGLSARASGGSQHPGGTVTTECPPRPQPHSGRRRPAPVTGAGPELEAQLTHRPPPATGSGPLCRLDQPGGAASPGCSRPQAGGSQVIRSRRGRQVHTGSPRSPGPQRGGARPEGVLSWTMGRGGPPTRPGPQALASGLRGSARAVATTQGRAGTGQAGRPRPKPEPC